MSETRNAGASTARDQARAQLSEPVKAAQLRAAAPEACAWVSANAGAGKTHVLKLRVLRLLLAGVEPSRILCLTYTKAAASEMASRVFDALTEWAIATDVELDRALIDLSGRPPTPEERAAARQLFAKAIETPGGLKVQTIHGFCEQLLQRFPLEAGLRPGFAIADDARARALVAEALDGTLALASEAHHPVGRALARMIVFAADERFSELVQQAARQGDWLAGMSQLSEQAAAANGNLDLIDVYYRGLFGIDQDATVDDLDARIAGLIDDATLEDAARVLGASKGKRDNEQADIWRRARHAKTPAERADAIRAGCLKKDLKAKSDSHFMGKDSIAEAPGLFKTLSNAREACETLTAQAKTLSAIEATRALIEIAGDMQARFSAAKQQHGMLDFDDLIARTLALLEADGAADWVLFKLDEGITHILVDEAQDTSPEQWRIVQSLAAPFFDDQAEAGPRTVFAVGDEKQSIYSFQGAEPRLFGESGDRFEALAGAAGVPFSRVPLNLSFRTVAPVLQAVDRVFADPELTPGLSYTDAAVKHEAFRVGEAGRVTVWPLEAGDDGEDAPAFAPLDDKAARSAVSKLCDRIADTIQSWLAAGRRLDATGKVIRPGDIMILVRNRHPVAAPMIAALKARGIPVAGADRMVLTDQLAVQDLIALGDFLTLPEDDLALANVLKSPLFDYSDDDLLRLAPGRKGSLWSAMIASAKDGGVDADAVGVLKKWRSEADFLPPFEFFSNLLSTASHRDGASTYRVRMVRRLGPDASDPLDEFLEAALRYDDEAAPSLQGFVSWLRANQVQIKRDMDTARDEVRLMTIHGAKGLEAPIVFLPDTTTNPAGRQNDSLLRLGGPDDRSASSASGSVAYPLETHLWTSPLAKSAPEPVEQAKQKRKRAAVQESNRLLYVAMTRARDELYVCGCAPKKGAPPEGCWYALIAEQLDGMLGAPDADGVRTYESRQDGETIAPAGDAPEKMADEPPLPAWAHRRIASEPRLQIPISPSRLAPLEQDEFGDPVDPSRAPATNSAEGRPAETGAASAPPPKPAKNPPAPSPRVLAEDFRFLRGNVTHALLQHLPQLPEENWAAAAETFVGQRAAGLSSRSRASIISETLTVLRHPEFSHAFSAGSRAEVAIAAEIPAPDGKGPSLKIAGSIDRLAVFDHKVLIIDFKTNRPPPRVFDDVPAAYVMQLAAYRLAISQMFPNHSVDAALLWTDTAHLMPLPAAALDAAQAALWTPGGPALDALGGQT
jgi:ATP-dependent helicase/nuclease subunit A